MTESFLQWILQKISRRNCGTSQWFSTFFSDAYFGQHFVCHVPLECNDVAQYLEMYL